MLQAIRKDLALVTNTPAQGNVEYLAQQWAKKYLQNLQVDSFLEDRDVLTLSDIISQSGREKTASKILESLRSNSAKAWNKTEALLSAEIKRHNINPEIINPWEIAEDSFKIYQKVLKVYTEKGTPRPLSFIVQLMEESNHTGEKASDIYTEQIAPSQLTTIIGADMGSIRRKYVSSDPRVIGFVSMQFHYTSQMLLQQLDVLEKSLIGAYFKVIDDHLYMPLQRAYEAASQHDYNSTALSAVQKLLPMSTKIAQDICQRVIEIYPNYYSMSGNLNDSVVKTSSIRDVEMFQVYLWVCALEGNISAIQQELFPLCVMLYPRLKVHWEIIRQMLHLLGKEIQAHLSAEQHQTLFPYFQALWQMFSPEVFG